MDKNWKNLSIKLFFVLVTLSVPVVLTMSSVRLILNPWYVEFEYRTPNFPADSYGFTLEERLDYSKIAIAYLLNDADISFLADLQFPEGEVAPPQSCMEMEDCTRLYNQRELKHMLDVKLVVQAALRVWLGALVFLVLSGLASWKLGFLASYRGALRGGGWLTVILYALVIGFVLVSFGVIFVFFHEVFFESGTWTFYFSDTLIRLFPQRFWRDTFLVVGSIPMLMGIGMGLLLRSKGE